MQSPICYLSRTEHFSSAHRLHNPQFSDAKNAEIYGKCNRVNGHGHNYVLHATFKGRIGDTGMVANITDIKCILKRVLDALDHKNIDLDVPWFAGDSANNQDYIDGSVQNDVIDSKSLFWNGRVSTVENICVYLWEMIRKENEVGLMLYSVRVEETVNNSCEYRGEQ